MNGKSQPQYPKETTMFNSQQTLQNRYQLQQKLGHTAAGRETWLATDLQSNQPVIVKLLAFSPQMQWEEIKLFEREAQVLKNINHPRIPRYRDYFFLAQEDGIEFPWFGLVQDYIPGTSLKELLDKGKIFTPAEVRDIASQLLNILRKLHELSPPVLHRDIKPSNLILGEDTRIHLVDFGAVQDKAKAEGVTFTVVGTSGYAPTEQLWGKTVAASDIYAVGATLIHLLNGVSPAELPQERMRLQFRHLAKIDSDFANWIEQCIQPAPEKRFTTAQEALSALPAIQHLPSTGKKTLPFVSNLYRYGIRFLAISIGFGFPLAIILPSSMNNATSARQSEGRQYIGAINRAQQAYFLEKNNFTSNIQELGLGIKTETENYSYSIRTTHFAAFHSATPRREKIKGYVGAVFLGTTSNSNEEITSAAIFCQAKSPSTKKLPNPIVENGIVKCAPGTEGIGGSESKTIRVSPDEKFAQTVINYAGAGNIDRAIAVAQTIKTDFFKAEALAAIIPKLTTTSQYNQAIDIAKTIKNYHNQGKALDGIVHQLAAKGEYNRAVEIAETIQSYYGGKEKMLTAIREAIPSGIAIYRKSQ